MWVENPNEYDITRNDGRHISFGHGIHFCLGAGKGFLFSDRGDVALRGFEDPMRLYEVSWQQSE